jgi:hypothetical protein
MVTGNSDMKNTLLLIAHLASLVISLPDGYICSMVSDSAGTTYKLIISYAGVEVEGATKHYQAGIFGSCSELRWVR